MHAYLKHPNINQLVVHKNGNRLDNRKQNLILGDKATINIVRKIQSNNSTGYRGVSRDKKTGRWQAHIGYKGAQYVLAHFDSAEEAAYAYNIAARDFWGDLAYQNDLSDYNLPKFKYLPIWDKFNIHKDFRVRKITDSGFNYRGDAKKITKRIEEEKNT
jgi:AP2 domain